CTASISSLPCNSVPIINGRRTIVAHYRVRHNACLSGTLQRDTMSLKEVHMLHYTIVFLVIALIAALFGFGGIAAGAVEIAKILFFVFLVLFLVSLVAGLMRRGGP